MITNWTTAWSILDLISSTNLHIFESTNSSFAQNRVSVYLEIFIDVNQEWLNYVRKFIQKIHCRPCVLLDKDSHGYWYLVFLVNSQRIYWLLFYTISYMGKNISWSSRIKLSVDNKGNVPFKNTSNVVSLVYILSIAKKFFAVLRKSN